MVQPPRHGRQILKKSLVSVFWIENIQSVWHRLLGQKAGLMVQVD
jgi:hypothetical protein